MNQDSKQNKKTLYSTVTAKTPLTAKEEIFTREYILLRDAKQAAIKAGYSPRSAAVTGHRLVHKKPNVKAAIGRLLSEIISGLDFDAHDVLQRLGHIALTNHSGLIQVVDGDVKITPTDELTTMELALYAGAVQKINEKGRKTIEIKTQDQMAALRLLCQYFGVLDRARQSPYSPRDEQVEAIRAVRSGFKTVDEVCLDLEEIGVPIPYVLDKMLSRQQFEEEDEGDGPSVMPTAEEMAERRKQKLAEIAKQKTNFVPARQAEVRELKEQLGRKNLEFAGQKR